MAAARQPTGTGMLGGPGASSMSPDQIAEGLAELVRAELAFPRAGSMFTGEQEYIFKHSLVRDVAYQLLPHKHRRPYHLGVARWLGRFASLDFAATIAEHLEQAGLTEEAIGQYQKAASYAHAQGATTEATWLETHLRELGGQPVQQPRDTRPLPQTGMLTPLA